MDFHYKVHRREDGCIEIHNTFGQRIDNLRGKPFATSARSKFTFTRTQITRMMKRFANGNGKAVRLKLTSGKIVTFYPKKQPTGGHPDMYKRAT